MCDEYEWVDIDRPLVKGDVILVEDSDEEYTLDDPVINPINGQKYFPALFATNKTYGTYKTNVVYDENGKCYHHRGMDEKFDYNATKVRRKKTMNKEFDLKVNDEIICKDTIRKIISHHVFNGLEYFKTEDNLFYTKQGLAYKNKYSCNSHVTLDQKFNSGIVSIKHREFKIEAGKFYKTRDGRKGYDFGADPFTHNGQHRVRIESEGIDTNPNNTFFLYENGRYIDHQRSEHNSNCDFVEEWKEPPVKVAKKFVNLLTRHENNKDALIIWSCLVNSNGDFTVRDENKNIKNLKIGTKIDWFTLVGFNVSTVEVTEGEQNV